MKISTFIIFIFMLIGCLVFSAYMLVNALFPDFNVANINHEKVVYADVIRLDDENNIINDIDIDNTYLSDIEFDVEKTLTTSRYVKNVVKDPFDEYLDSRQENYFRNLKALTFNEKYSPTFTLDLPVGVDTSFKSYMCYHTITARNSAQWKFLKSGEYGITTNENGFLMYKNYYIVALGSYYTKGLIGTTFRIILDSGVMFDCIVGDAKADIDTDVKNMYHPKGENEGEIIEFLTACGMSGKDCTSFEQTMPQNVKSLGNMAYFGFEGNVVSIQRLNDNSIVNDLY